MARSHNQIGGQLNSPTELLMACNWPRANSAVIINAIRHLGACQRLARCWDSSDVRFLDETLLHFGARRANLRKKLIREIWMNAWSLGIQTAPPPGVNQMRLSTLVPRRLNTLIAAQQLLQFSKTLQRLSQQRMDKLSTQAILAVLDVVLPVALPASPELTRSWLAGCAVGSFSGDWFDPPASVASASAITQIPLPVYVRRLMTLIVRRRTVTAPGAALFHSPDGKDEWTTLDPKRQLREGRGALAELSCDEDDHAKISKLFSDWTALWKATRKINEARQVTTAALAQAGLSGVAIRMTMSPVQPYALPAPILRWTEDTFRKPPMVNLVQHSPAELPKQNSLDIWRRIVDTENMASASSLMELEERQQRLAKAIRELVDVLKWRKELPRGPEVAMWLDRWWDKLGGENANLRSDIILLHWFASRASAGNRSSAYKAIRPK